MQGMDQDTYHEGNTSQSRSRTSSRRTRQASSKGKALPSVPTTYSRPASPTKEQVKSDPSDSRFEAFAERMSTNKEVRKRRSRTFSNAPLPTALSVARNRAAQEQPVEDLQPAIVIEPAAKPPPRPPRNARRGERLSIQVSPSTGSIFDQALTAMNDVGQSSLALSSPSDFPKANSSSPLASPISIAPFRDQSTIHWLPSDHSIANSSVAAYGLPSSSTGGSHSAFASDEDWERNRKLSSLFSGLGFTGAINDLSLAAMRETADLDNPAQVTEGESDVFESAEETLEDALSKREEFASFVRSQSSRSQDLDSKSLPPLPPNIAFDAQAFPQTIAEVNRRSASIRGSHEYSWVLSSITQQQPIYSDDSNDEQSQHGVVVDAADWRAEKRKSSAMVNSVSERNIRAWLPTIARAGTPPLSSPELTYTEPSTPSSSTHEFSMHSHDDSDSADTSWHTSVKAFPSPKISVRPDSPDAQYARRVSGHISKYSVPIMQPPPPIQKTPKQRSKTIERINKKASSSQPSRTRSNTSSHDQSERIATKKDLRRRSQSVSLPRPISRSPRQPASPHTASWASPAATSLCDTPTAQKTFRSSLPDRDYQALQNRYGKAELKRQEIIWELCDTEESFVNGLRGVIRVFMQPLRTPLGRWIEGIPTAVSRLFDWLDDILHLHTQISGVLRSAQAAQSPITLRIADVFLKYITRLEVHQPYIVRFAHVTQIIDAMTSDVNSDFGEFVRMQQGLPECGSMTLSSFLLKPVQRLMKYPLFFKQLLELTPAAHPDHLATLSLLHSTDVTIRVMQEVKAREEEYERIKVMQRQMRGLPPGFQLARRDRKLLAHGMLRRVHISDRDQLRLGVENLSSMQRQQTQLSPSMTSTSSFADRHPTESEYSSGYSGSSHQPMSQPSSKRSSTYLNSPTLSAGAFGQSTPSIRSKSSSASLHADSSKYLNLQPANEGNVLRTKAKETPLHVFVFSDVVVLTTKHSEGIRLMRSGKTSSKKETKETYKLIEGLGLSRIVGVEDISGRTEHEHLLDIDLLPISSEAELSTISLCDASLASSIYLAIPTAIAPASRSRSAHSGLRPNEANAKECDRWVAAFERSFFSALRSLSFPTDLGTTSSWSTKPNAGPSFVSEEDASDRLNPNDRHSFASIVEAGLPMPRSPSQQDLQRQKRQTAPHQHDDAEYEVEEERQERGWWAARLKKVKKEWQAEEAAVLQARMLSAVGTGRPTLARDASHMTASALRRGPRSHPVNGRAAEEMHRTASRQTLARR